jgi:LmbE family N-acetylglucosaminyl deacetylase
MLPFVFILFLFLNIMKKVLLLLTFLLPSILFAQSNFTILSIAAHPDDEDGATLAYYSKLKGYKSYTIFYTRGEGGQNETGPELYDELGKIREQECYDAAAVQGSTAYFLGELDFGFSKTAKETFKFWGGEDSVLARIVYMIRALRPDVIISNHDTVTTKPNRQHGHHQAAGITVYEAFDKAADPNYHPEQLTGGLTIWQVKKLFFRRFNETDQDIYHINISETEPGTNKTIREISKEALSKHKTQGMDKIPDSSFYFYGDRKYLLIRSDKMYPVEGNDLFEGLVPESKPDQNTELRSYQTFYTYRNVNPEDSLRILGSVKHNSAAKIGLVKTYDNTIENILNTFKIKFDTLSPLAIEVWDLNVYQTIILDLRTYLYRPDVLSNNERLIKYVRDGGNLICFYNKPQDWNGKGLLAPYPIHITSERVTEEDADVNVLQASHILFNRPNKVGPADWSGWVQERNIYLPSDDTAKTSAKYERLLYMQDENDPVPSTALLWTGYGKGTYTYCSLALYRQLRIFNEGALKIFMNMISQKNAFMRSLDNFR